jgi:hypothetical protein
VTRGQYIIGLSSPEIEVIELTIEGINFETKSGTNMFWVHSPKVTMDRLIVNNVEYGPESEALKSLTMIAEFHCKQQNCSIIVKNSEFRSLSFFPNLFDFKTVGTSDKKYKLLSALTPA